MPEFSYLAQDGTGRPVTGIVSAISRREAVTVLASRTLIPVHVTEAKRSPTGRRRRRWSATQYSQLSDLLRTGVPLLKALDVLRDQAPTSDQRLLAQDLRDRLTDGASLSESMRAQDHAFDSITLGIVQAGEEGGFLEEALRRIAALQERTEEVRSRITGALIYPLLLLLAGTLLVLGLLVFFVPNFSPIFERLAAQNQLPWATRVLIGASDFLRGYGGLLALLIGGLLVMARGAISWRTLRSQLLGYIVVRPYLGLVLRETMAARFCRVLGTLLKNDVPLVTALRITRGAVGDARFGERIDEIATQVADGSRIAPRFSGCPYMPTDVLAMIAVGEQANTLDTVLMDAAEILDRRASRRLDLYLKLLEPALLLCMAGIVLFLVIGLMLPIFDASAVEY